MLNFTQLADLAESIKTHIAAWEVENGLVVRGVKLIRKRSDAAGEENGDARELEVELDVHLTVNSNREATCAVKNNP